MTRLLFVLLLTPLVFLGCMTAPPRDLRWDPDQIDRLFDSMVDPHLEAGYENPILSESEPLPLSAGE